MQILIPMSGLGSRFSAAGYSNPKPFIQFLGKTMIENVIENLGYNNDFILVVRKEHYDTYQEVFNRLAQQVSGFDVVMLDSVTRGAAESCLAAKHKLDPDSSLMIANCDQMLDYDSNDFKSWFYASALDGAIMTFESQDPKNSYAEIDKNGLVCRTVEKQVISPHATNGIYIWKRASDFISAAEEMIEKDLRTNNEFYVCPTFNVNIARGQHIGIYFVRKHWPIGDPQSLHNYLDWLLTTGKK